MLLVRTKLKASPIHGFGLFAAERVPAGQVIWRFTPGLDAALPLENIFSQPLVIQGFISRYCSLDPTRNCFIVYVDDARFINHSFQPNVWLDKQQDILIAAKDIESGEEITEDYSVTEWDGPNMVRNWIPNREE
ncbi:MAG TPA: SET domain-containing protein [Pyrinomonadaceae bacterium]|nr:SET domain-containing protein [Pyrinomonadaceae bacterium]